MAIDRNLQPHMQAYTGSVSNHYSRFILAATLQVMVAVVYYVAICAGVSLGQSAVNGPGWALAATTVDAAAEGSGSATAGATASGLRRLHTVLNHTQAHRHGFPDGRMLHSPSQTLPLPPKEPTWIIASREDSLAPAQGYLAPAEAPLAIAPAAVPIAPAVAPAGISTLAWGYLAPVEAYTLPAPAEAPIAIAPAKAPIAPADLIMRPAEAPVAPADTTVRHAEAPIAPADAVVRPAEAPDGYSPSPAPKEAPELANEPALPQKDGYMSPEPVATESLTESGRQPAWHASVEDGGYLGTLGHGYDSWKVQVNTPFEFKTSPRLYTKEAVFNFSRPASGGRCGAQPGLEGVAAPCGVYVHPVELYNVSILEWRTDCRELRRVLLRGALSATAPVLSLAIVGSAAAEYQTSSERTATRVDTVAEATFTMYTAAISRASPPPFTAAFLKIATALPLKFGDEHHAFVRTYGTYFVEEVTMGGVQADYYRLEEQTTRLMAERGVSAEVGVLGALRDIVGVGLANSVQTEVSTSVRNSVASSIRYGIESYEPVSWQDALDDPSKISPKPIKVTLTPIENLFRAEFGLPEHVQRQYANIVVAAKMKVEDAPSVPSPAPDDMDPALCSAGRRSCCSFGYVVMCLSLSAIAALVNINV